MKQLSLLHLNFEQIHFCNSLTVIYEKSRKNYLSFISQNRKEMRRIKANFKRELFFCNLRTFDLDRAHDAKKFKAKNI